MEEVIRLFKQIQETNSTNGKKAIIKANKDNELFKKCLRFLLDSNITTGIADSKLRKVNNSTSKIVLMSKDLFMTIIFLMMMNLLFMYR